MHNTDKYNNSQTPRIFGINFAHILQCWGYCLNNVNNVPLPLRSDIIKRALAEDSSTSFFLCRPITLLTHWLSDSLSNMDPRDASESKNDQSSQIGRKGERLTKLNNLPWIQDVLYQNLGGQIFSHLGIRFYMYPIWQYDGDDYDGDDERVRDCKRAQLVTISTYRAK